MEIAVCSIALTDGGISPLQQLKVYLLSLNMYLPFYNAPIPRNAKNSVGS